MQRHGRARVNKTRSKNRHAARQRREHSKAKTTVYRGDQAPKFCWSLQRGPLGVSRASLTASMGTLRGSSAVKKPSGSDDEDDDSDGDDVFAGLDFDNFALA